MTRQFEFKRDRVDKIPRARILCELRAAAEQCGLTEFGWREFNKIPGISRGTVVREFGSWNLAIDALKADLEHDGKSLALRRRVFLADDVLFAETMSCLLKWNGCGPISGINHLVKSGRRRVHMSPITHTNVASTAGPTPAWCSSKPGWVTASNSTTQRPSTAEVLLPEKARLVQPPVPYPVGTRLRG